MILDAILLLSSWSGNLDVNQYILKEHRSLVNPLQYAFTLVPAEDQHQWCVMMTFIRFVAKCMCCLIHDLQRSTELGKMT